MIYAIVILLIAVVLCLYVGDGWWTIGSRKKRISQEDQKALDKLKALNGAAKRDAR